MSGKQNADHLRETTRGQAAGMILVVLILATVWATQIYQALPAAPNPELKPALVLENELADNYAAFAEAVRPLSPASPNYWRRVRLAWQVQQLSKRWSEFDRRLAFNARQEAAAETGVPE